jgi:hypothetical protein
LAIFGNAFTNLGAEKVLKFINEELSQIFLRHISSSNLSESPLALADMWYKLLATVPRLL